MNEGLSNLQIQLFQPNVHTTYVIRMQHNYYSKAMVHGINTLRKFNILTVIYNCFCFKLHLCQPHCYIIRSYIPINEQIITYIHT